MLIHQANLRLSLLELVACKLRNVYFVTESIFRCLQIPIYLNIVRSRLGVLYDGALYKNEYIQLSRLFHCMRCTRLVFEQLPQKHLDASSDNRLYWLTIIYIIALR